MYCRAINIYGLLVCLSISTLVTAQKTDQVFLKNGDIITCEIKKMKFAKLSIDQDGPGIISVKWEYVVKIRSEKTFQVTMQDGLVLVTKLDSSFFAVQENTLDNIVEIVRLKDKFLQRMSGDVSLGFNYAKSSDIFTFNLASNVTYLVPKNEMNFKTNAVITKSGTDTAAAKKKDISLGYLRRLENSFYAGSTIGWQQNTELGLNNRFSINGIAGKIPIINNRRRLLAGIGLSLNEEQSNESNTYKTNLESLATIQFKEFRYVFPDLSIDAVYAIFPSLTDWGRIRMEFQLNTSVEVFKDFDVGLSFYDSYDNRPPQGAASKNDYSINFTITYKFGK
jgi:hypothetical protein